MKKMNKDDGRFYIESQMGRISRSGVIKRYNVPHRIRGHSYDNLNDAKMAAIGLRSRNKNREYDVVNYSAGKYWTFDGFNWAEGIL